MLGLVMDNDWTNENSNKRFVLIIFLIIIFNYIITDITNCNYLDNKINKKFNLFLTFLKFFIVSLIY